MALMGSFEAATRGTWVAKKADIAKSSMLHHAIIWSPTVELRMPSGKSISWEIRKHSQHRVYFYCLDQCYALVSYPPKSSRKAQKSKQQCSQPRFTPGAFPRMCIATR